MTHLDRRALYSIHTSPRTWFQIWPPWITTERNFNTHYVHNQQSDQGDGKRENYRQTDELVSLRKTFHRHSFAPSMRLSLLSHLCQSGIIRLCEACKFLSSELKMTAMWHAVCVCVYVCVGVCTLLLTLPSTPEHLHGSQPACHKEKVLLGGTARFSAI